MAERCPKCGANVDPIYKSCTLCLYKPNPSGLDARKAECPYCHCLLKKIPDAKTKCPHCGKYMRVKTRPSDMARVIVTEKESEKIDEEWAIAQGRHDIYLAEKRAKEAEKEEFEIARKTLRGKFGLEPSEHDIKWAVLNTKLPKCLKSQDWRGVSSVYKEQAIILAKEGKDNKQLLNESCKAAKESNKEVLRSYLESGVVEKVEILTAGSESCPLCQDLEGKVYTIKKALEVSPLPVEDCTHKYGCRCCYIPVV